MAVGEVSAPRTTKAARRASRPRQRAAAGALLAALIATSACGARWSDDERAAVLARADGTAASTNDDSADDVTEASGSDTTLPGAAVDGTTTGGTGGTTGGTTTGGTAAGSSGPRPCAAASNATGVTPETLTVGNISTVSGPVPGLGETSVAAVRAYVAYRNSTGGVCGRKLILKAADDGFENGRYRTLITQLSSEVLGLAGGFAAGDGGGVDVINAQKLPGVTTAFSDAFQAIPTMFDINPPFADVHAVTSKFTYLRDQLGVRTAALVYISQASAKIQVEQQRAQMEAVGIKVVNEQALPLSTLSYDAAARAVANSKADYLLFPGNDSLSASMARAMAETGYKLKVSEYLPTYGSKFIELAGAAAEGTVDWSRALPKEEAGPNPEQNAFLQWMARSSPGVAADAFAADTWAAAKAFIDNIEALPGPISREALVAQLRSVGTYDGDGFFGPIQLGKELSNGCYVAMKVVSGKWQRLTPARGFLC